MFGIWEKRHQRSLEITLSITVPQTPKPYIEAHDTAHKPPHIDRLSDGKDAGLILAEPFHMQHQVNFARSRVEVANHQRILLVGTYKFRTYHQHPEKSKRVTPRPH